MRDHKELLFTSCRNDFFFNIGFMTLLRIFCYVEPSLSKKGWGGGG